MNFISKTSLLLFLCGTSNSSFCSALPKDMSLEEFEHEVEKYAPSEHEKQALIPGCILFLTGAVGYMVSNSGKSLCTTHTTTHNSLNCSREETGIWNPFSYLMIAGGGLIVTGLAARCDRTDELREMIKAEKEKRANKKTT